jgi:hypothetical protein
MQYNQQPLPVSAEQLQCRFVQGNQLPPLPNVQEVGQVSQQEAYNLHGELINLLQAGTQKGPIRVFLFNLYGQNGFVNQGYTDLYGFAIEYYLFLRASGQPDIQRAVDDTVKCDIPRIMAQYPALQGFLNEQQINDLNQFVQLSQAISQHMQAFYSQQINNQNAGPPQWGGQSNMMNSNQGHRPGPAMQFGSGGFTGHGNTNMAPGGGGGRPGAGAWSQPNQPIQQTTRRPGMSGPNAGSMLTQPNGPTGSPGGSRRPAVGSPATSSLNTNPGVIPGAEQKGDDMRVVTEENRQIGHLSAVAEVRNPTPPIDREVELISSEYIPARTKSQRIVKGEKKGRAEYKLVEIEGSQMEYSDHETNPDLIELSRKQKTGPKVGPIPSWEGISMPSEISKDDTPENVDIMSVDEPLYLKETVTSYSVMHGRSLAMEQYDRLNLSGDERMIEYYIDLLTPIGDKSLAENIQKLRETVTLTELVDVFNLMAKEIDARVWYRLHDLLTDVLLRRLRGGLGMRINVDSITDDYDDLMDMLAKDYHTNAVDRFKRNTHIAILKTLNMREKNNTLLLSETISVTELPWTSNHIELVMEAKYVMLSKGVNDQMTAAMLKLFERTNVKECNMSRRYVVTLDNVVIELHPGDMGTSTLLISKGNLCC